MWETGGRRLLSGCFSVRQPRRLTMAGDDFVSLPGLFDQMLRFMLPGHEN
ncbi:hypothetical protein HMPREF3038_00923 [Akkermansia sp. KLE1797]|nr:hypothetical protein HMPREF3038_00923 [Akkermansia sp. KLE1797]